MKKILFIFTISFLVVFQLQKANAQMVISEIKAVYKSKIDGRIISDKEFQTYKGRHIFHKYIKGKKGTLDTILITPPKSFRKKKTLINTKAPFFSVTDIYGNAYNINQLKDKVVVMNYWFVACPPCIQEIPELNQLVNYYKDNSDVVFLAFAKDTKALLGKFLAHTEFEYAIIPNAKEIAKKYGVYAYPTHVIVDKKGIVQYSSIGFKEGSINELHNKINQLLK